MREVTPDIERAIVELRAGDLNGATESLSIAQRKICRLAVDTCDTAATAADMFVERT